MNPWIVVKHFILFVLSPVGSWFPAKTCTSCKVPEGELGPLEERFSKAFHASPHPIAITSLEDGRVIDVNDAFLRMTGYRRE